MKNDPAVHDLSNIGANRYPHLKITCEEFPRVFATRRIENDGDLYFGAFLPKTAARILIDFVNRTFRLRSCDIPIDGEFPVPCTQYFRRRCVAPCVSRLCTHKEYMQIVELVGMFLGDDRAGLVARFEELINEFSASEKFEAAARLRDIMIEIDRFWNDSRRRVWLSDAVDTYAVEESKESLTIFLVTHRGRKVLGRKVFTTRRKTFGSSASALSHLIDSFYLFHLPKEIRIPERLPDISALQDRLSRRFGRPATITVSNPAKKGVNAFRGLNLSHSEHLLDRVKPIATPQMISSDLKAMFGLTFRPKRVEAFDVAHISGTNFAAAWAVWEEGRFQSADYRFLISDKHSEPDVLANAVLTSIIDDPVTERLILLDGGIGQLNKVLVAVADRPHPPVATAVKPTGKHSSIAAFLTSSGSSIPFNVDSPTHSMLQLLRDEAHDLANRVHRDYREMLPFYEAKGFDRPLVVPLRFHEIDGGADDLIPIDAK